MRHAARTAVMGVLATALAALAAGTVAPAAADPVPPADPSVPLPVPGEPVPLQQTGQTMLGQFAQTAQANPFGMLTDLLAASPQPALLGQAPLPPETVSSGPGADPWTLAQGLKPNNFRMPTPDQVSPYALAPNDAPSPFARIDAWKGVHAMVHSSLGRMPGAELGQPLPGTAAPPGSNLPAGLEQFYVDPAALPPVAPPADAPVPAAPPLPPPAG